MLFAYVLNTQPENIKHILLITSQSILQVGADLVVLNSHLV